MKAEDIRAMTNEELALAERNMAEELWKLRFQHHTGQLQNTASLHRLRRTLARLRTVTTERARGISAAPGSEG